MQLKEIIFHCEQETIKLNTSEKKKMITAHGGSYAITAHKLARLAGVFSESKRT